MAADAQPRDDDGLAESEIHDVLRNDRRRLTLDALRDADRDGLSVRELSEEIAATETDERPPPRDKRQSVYVSLLQTHLPKLDELGIVAYDEDDKEVRLRDRAREVAVYTEVVPAYGLSWGEFYVGLGLVGMLVAVAVLVGVPGFGGLGAATVALTFGSFSGALVGAAAYHVYSQQDRLVFQRIRS